MSKYNNTVRRIECNLKGRDIIVGDIHGHFTRLYEALTKIGFDGAQDRLFSVGDLVDRGPESEKALVWLRQPWFFAIRGNHEEAAVEFAAGNADIGSYRSAFGGGWNIDNPQETREQLAQVFAALPVGFEIATASGIVGVLHADCPVNSWDVLKARLANGGLEADAVAGMCVWSRDRADRLNDGLIEGVRAVVVGHTPVDRVTSLGNVIYIDTQGWLRGHFTLLDVTTLRQAEPIPACTLDWAGA